MTTIGDYANTHNTQPYEIAAYLDLGTEWDDHTDLEPWQIDILDHSDDDGVYDARLTAADVARTLDIKPSTWRAYVARSQAPAADGQIDGRTPYWRASTIESWRSRTQG